MAVLCLGAALTACSSPSRYSQAHDSAPDAPLDPVRFQTVEPRVEPKSRYGNPASYVVRGKRYYTLKSSRNYKERGVASWYGTKFHGHRTSSGETYDMYRMSAAHKTLPLPTYARVTNLRNGRSVIVKINDRGPFHDNRLIDLSYAAATKLDILGEGTGMVEVEAIDAAAHQKARRRAAELASQPKVAAAQKPATEPELYLQLGAFTQKANAERLRTRLADIELPGPVSIIEGYSRQKRVYRVRVGPLQTVEAADQLSAVITGRGMPPPSVVID